MNKKITLNYKEIIKITNIHSFYIFNGIGFYVNIPLYERLKKESQCIGTTTVLLGFSVKVPEKHYYNDLKVFSYVFGEEYIIDINEEEKQSAIVMYKTIEELNNLQYVDKSIPNSLKKIADKYRLKTKRYIINNNPVFVLYENKINRIYYTYEPISKKISKYFFIV